MEACQCGIPADGSAPILNQQKGNDMHVLVNNNLTPTDAQNVEQLAAQLELPSRGVALAVNQRIIPRAEWTNTLLTPNDNITIIKAAFGG